MRVERKVVGLEKLGCLRKGRIIKKDGAENGAFGFHAGGKATVKSEVSGGHLYARFIQKHSSL
jgi:hypothetical protein